MDTVAARAGSSVPPPAEVRRLLGASTAAGTLAVVLFLITVAMPDDRLTAASWAASAVCAGLACLVCAMAGLQQELTAPVRRTWRRTSVALSLVTLLLIFRLAQWMAGGSDLSAQFRVLNILTHVVVVVLLAAPVYRRSIGLKSFSGRLAFGLDVGALTLATATYVWFFPVKALLDSATGSGPALQVGVAMLLAAVVGVVLGAKAVFISVVSVQRRVMLLLGIVLTLGGALPALLVATGRADLGASMLLVPSVCLLVVVGARSGAQVVPLRAEDAELWRRRYSRLPYLAVAATDALLLYSLVDGAVRDRLVVGVSAVVLTAIAVVRQVNASAELRSHEQRFRSLVQNSYDVITINEPDGTITYMGGGSQRIFGRAPDQRIGGNITHLIHPDDRDAVRQHFVDVALRPGSSVLFKSRLRHSDGSWRWIEVLSTNMLDEPSVRGIVCNTRDITETHELAERLSYEASHDLLTGLANRGLFQQQVAQGALTCGGCAGVYVVLVDLDNFKIVNDTLGHAVGDTLLVDVATCLRASVRSTDTVARLGGDEFALLLEDVSAATVEGVVATIIAALRHQSVDGTDLQVHASFGIVAAAPGDQAGDLLRRADIAMYRAKGRGDGGWQHYQEGMEAIGGECDRWAAQQRA